MCTVIQLVESKVLVSLCACILRYVIHVLLAWSFYFQPDWAEQDHRSNTFYHSKNTLGGGVFHVFMQHRHSFWIQQRPLYTGWQLTDASYQHKEGERILQPWSQVMMHCVHSALHPGPEFLCLWCAIPVPEVCHYYKVQLNILGGETCARCLMSLQIFMQIPNAFTHWSTDMVNQKERC